MFFFGTVYTPSLFRAGLLLFFLCILLFITCDRQSAQASGRQTPAETILIDQTEEELARIAENARNTLPIFLRRLARTEPGDSGFYVKYPFMTDDDSGINAEQVWLAGIHFRSGSYYGILSSTPKYFIGVKKGDTVIFDTDIITDWMYIQNGKIHGGRSIKYLLEKIPENQRSIEQAIILQMYD
jgi:uncharacterized protein YegJ (DUF2314 family)